MTPAELEQALAGLLAAVAAVSFAVLVLIPREPIAPGLLGDHPDVVPLDEGAPGALRTALPVWRPPLPLLDDTGVVGAVVDLSPAELDRLDALLRHRPGRRPGLDDLLRDVAQHPDDRYPF